MQSRCWRSGRGQPQGMPPRRQPQPLKQLSQHQRLPCALQLTALVPLLALCQLASSLSCQQTLCMMTHVCLCCHSKRLSTTVKATLLEQQPAIRPGSRVPFPAMCMHVEPCILLLEPIRCM
ncbi:hypothetical protein ABPG75_007226 [Micractinium tetrahymenae]